MFNKYWKISGWTIFDEYDKVAHKIAIKEIWECVTVSAEIKYYTEIEIFDNSYEVCDIEHSTKSTCIVEIMQVWVAKWIFTFVKKK